MREQVEALMKLEALEEEKGFLIEKKTNAVSEEAKEKYQSEINKINKQIKNVQKCIDITEQ